MATARAPAIGIDLGTSNSCAAVVLNGKVKVIWNDSGNRITPSCVAFTEDDRLVGDKAKAQAVLNPTNTIFEAKRLIGRQFDDPGVQERLDQWPCSVVNVQGNPKFQVEYKGEMKRYTPEEISAMVLIGMKTISEKVIGSTVTDAVITVPAYFNDSQRQATLDAGKIAGLNVLKLLNEPTAAALAYGFDQKLRSHQTVLVFDFGGGTLDVAILSIAGNNFEVLAVDGDTFLGGSDFDLCLVTHFVEQIERKYNKDISTNARALCKLRIACETAKKNLSSAAVAQVIVESILSGDRDYKQNLTRAKFNMLCAHLFKAAMKPIDTVLKYAKMDANDIDEVVLAGGSTLIPKIKELLQKKFSKLRLNETINPDEAVAYGAALHAAVLGGNRSVDKIRLKDVTSQSLGINILGNLMSKIIPRNTKIPAKKTRRFVTTVDYQTGVDLKVYQGERSNSNENNLIGELALEDIQPARKGVPQIIVTFSIDDNGILTVSAVDVSTGNNKELVIKMDKGRLSTNEIERMVAEANDYVEEMNHRKLKELRVMN
ncbi:Heat shock protein 70 family [Trinorchestia longiramus]|nr:Heat shock protein 70 family [Trinorchestia longiramus]